VNLTPQLLADIIAGLPPPLPKQTFCSCKLFPAERAVGFHAADGEEFHIAHPDFWRAAVVIEQVPTFACKGFDLHGIPLIDLDRDRDEYVRVTGLMLQAMERQMKRETSPPDQARK
jgi:hypothetical protein